MKKLAILVVLVVAFALMGGVALAAETPHGPFDANSAVCAACHRAHTSTAEYLLATPRVTSLCIGCHDGSGADTDVVNGAFVVNGTQLDKNVNRGDGGYPTVLDNGYNHGTWGTADNALMGGGFLNVMYDGASSITTSKHMDPTGGNALTTYKLQFGAGDAANAPGTVKVFLDCVDCHMPHRSPNYRMLRVKPTGYSGTNLSVPQTSRVTSNNSVVSPVNATEEAAYAGGAVGRRYTEDSGMFNYTITNPTVAGAGDGISKWCGLGCHDYYYRSAVRGNNGETGAPSPAMQTRVQTSIPLGSQPTPTVVVVDASAIAGDGTAFIWIKGEKFNVTAKASNTLTVDPDIDQGAAVVAGTPVSIEGKGMEVYYNLDGVAGADPGFMHAIDVDLNYYPRNLSSGVQPLGANLALGGYGNKMPVADMTNNTTYDNTDRLTCLTCHRAHGSDVTMQKEAAIPARNYGNTDPAGFPAGTDSMLLRLENRAVCQQCHQMPTGF